MVMDRPSKCHARPQYRHIHDVLTVSPLDVPFALQPSLIVDRHPATVPQWLFISDDSIHQSSS